MMPFEIWQDPATKVTFYFSHTDETMTTGVMMIPAGSALPKHNRPNAFENLVQVSGKCLMQTFGENDTPTDHILEVGNTLRMEKGQFHIHSNPYDEPSYTLFKAEGDITEVMEVVRKTFQNLTQN